MLVIPKPSRIKELEGEVELCSTTAVKSEMVNSGKFIRKQLENMPSGNGNTLNIVKDNALKTEEYTISCKDGNIIIKASTEQGAYYAYQTLLQLSNGGGKLKACDINDKPQYAYRGFMMDCGRHYWSIEHIKEVLDLMAAIKMNIFHWHLTEDQGWRAEIKKYPLLTQKGSIRKSTATSLKGYNSGNEPRDNTPYGEGLYYTQEQMREIVAYAKERFIDVIPEIDMPGHLVSAISCYPNLSCEGRQLDVSVRWGVMDDIACCGKEDIYNFAKDVIDELLDIFPYKYFHIGGDEVPKKKWKQCPKCQAKIKELNLKDENALQSHFNNVIAAHLKSRGRSMIGWNEILESQESLDNEIIAQWWTRHKGSENEKKWLEKGNKLVISMIEYVYMDHPYSVRALEKTYSFSAKAIGIDDDSNIIGVEAPQWTEYIRDREKFDINTTARLIAMSEVGWTATSNKNYKDFENRLEALRGYFDKLGSKICPIEVYRGESIKKRWIFKPDGMVKWRNDPYYEVTFARSIIANKKK